MNLYWEKLFKPWRSDTSSPELCPGIRGSSSNTLRSPLARLRGTWCWYQRSPFRTRTGMSYWPPPRWSDLISSWLCVRPVQWSGSASWPVSRTEHLDSEPPQQLVPVRLHTVWQLKHVLYLLLLWARCQTSVCTGSPGPPEHRRDSSPWTPCLSSPVAVTTGSCLLGSASGSRGAAGGGGRALAPETAARLVGDVWFSFSFGLYIEIDSSVKRQKYAFLFSPFWIISARFGWANTLATLNTISAFLAFTRSVLMVLFRNTWKSFVYMSRFSWTNDSLWKRNQTNNKYIIIIICNSSSP